MRKIPVNEECRMKNAEPAAGLYIRHSTFGIRARWTARLALSAVAVALSALLSACDLGLPAGRTPHREGNRLDKISGTRFFCTQCHVPQVDAKPLVTNTFQNASEVK